LRSDQIKKQGVNGIEKETRKMPKCTALVHKKHKKEKESRQGHSKIRQSKEL
jgi:hypothetical protein